MSQDLRAHLARQVLRVDWRPLRPHAERGALILVDSSLDLVDVALAVAQDDAPRVRKWMEARQLQNPTVEQVEAWADEREEKFTALIVQPYVLVVRDRGPA